MPRERYAGFVGPSYLLDNPIAAADRTFNWIPSRVESGTGAASYVFDPAPGFAVVSALDATHPVRGLITLNGFWWAAINDTIYQSVIPSGTQVSAVGLPPSATLVSMAINGNLAGSSQIVIASDGALFCLTVPQSGMTGTLTPIPQIPATSVLFINGFFVALDPSTSSIHLSALNDGTTWDPLDVEQRSDSGDKWQQMILSHKEIWLFGNQSTSIYFNSDDPTFPFQPNPSANIARGIAAPNSVQLFDDGAPIWLADDLTVRKGIGYVPQRISTFAVEQAIAKYPTVTDADAFTYSERGHWFYVLNFPTAQATWVFDTTGGLWHQRGPWNGHDYQVLPVRTCIDFGGVNLVGGRVRGTLYSMSQASVLDINQDGTMGSTALRRERRAPHLLSELNRVIYDRFQLHLEVGLGLGSAQGSAPQLSQFPFDPQVMLRWSNDGGQSWSQPIATSAGETGQYKARAVWRKLGQARDRIFEISCADPIPWRVVDAYLDARPGSS